ncbi:hypothetical protein CEW88_11590 [Alloyangia pacifica]|uniref:DUF3987 domain-containing protein n=1 Tax=Alloyangia pacifica TaxID=311180 RepID=A0A2U8HEZ5_9RHOB|nr:hypothetical protein [Alloyangia pacifica]AWI84270.1 hypothetical protein CEW88_11590 [Alloyangia pacifica]
MAKATLQTVEFQGTLQTSENAPRGTWGAVRINGAAHTARQDKAGGSGYSPVRFKGNYRRNEKGVERSAAVFDVEQQKDGRQPHSPDVMAARLNCRSVLYTTFRHTSEAPRYRIALPFAELVQISDVETDKEMMLILADRLGISDVLDTGKTGCGSFFYSPACPAERLSEARTLHVDGPHLDPSSALEEAQDRVRKRREAVAAVPKGKGSNKAANALRGKLKPIDEILPLLGYEWRGGDRWLSPYSKSGSPGVVVLTGADGIPRMCSHHQNDPLCLDVEVFGTRAHDALDLVVFDLYGAEIDIAEAMKELGKGIPERYAAPTPATIRRELEKRRETLAPEVIEEDYAGEIFTLTDRFGEAHELTEHESAELLQFYPDGPPDDLDTIEALLAIFMEERESQTAQLAEIPEIPGMVGELAAWVAGRSRRILPREVCVFTALAALSAGVANRAAVVWPQGPSALNLDILLRMGTGTGKEELRATVSALATRMGGATPFDRFGSKEGGHREMLENQHSAVVLMIDEYAKMLLAVASGKDPISKAILDWAMAAFANPFGTLTATPVKNKRDQLGPVEGPCLAAFGTCAEDPSDALAVSDVGGGFLNRKIFLSGPEVAPLKPVRQARIKVIPKDVEEGVARLGRLFAPLTRMPGLNVGSALQPVEGCPREVLPIIPDDGALTALERWQDVAEGHTQDTRDPDRVLWARAMQHVVSVAGLIALGERATDPRETFEPVEMRQEHVAAAMAVVRRSMRDLAALAETKTTRPAHGQIDAKRELLKVFLRLARGEWLSRDALRRKSKILKGPEREAALLDMEAEGTIESRERRTGKGAGRPVTEYRKSWRG